MTCISCFLLHKHIHACTLTLLSFAVSLVNVCLSSVAGLSFFMPFFHLPPSSISLSTLYIFFVSTLASLSLFLPLPLTPPHPILPASCPPYSLPIEVKLPVVLDERRYSVSQPTADRLYCCIQPIGPYKEK